MNDLDNKTKKSIANFFNDSQTSSSTNESKTATELNEPNYTEIVSNIYKEVLGREPDLGGLKYYSSQLKYGIITKEKLRSILKESDEYKGEFNPSKSSSKSHEPLKSSEQETSLLITYCMICTDRLNEVKPYIESVLQYVDKFVFVDGGSTDGTLEYIKELSSKSEKMTFLQVPWKDKFSEQRNNYLEHLRSLGYEGWVLTSDSDEHFPVDTLSQLRSLVLNSEHVIEYTGIKFRVEDIIVGDDDRSKILSKNINNYWKPLMFKFSPELHYEGEPHETLAGQNLIWFQTDLIYQHIRSNFHIMARACENYFISNSNRYSDRWAEFRYLCTKNEILTFKDYWARIENHSLPKEVEKWLEVHKDDAFDEGDSELRQTYILYNEILPARNKEKAKKEDNLSNTVTVSQSPPNSASETSTSLPFQYQISTPTTFISTLSNVFSGKKDIKQSEYELINHYCEQCSSPNKILLELVIHHKHGITMCEECWIGLSDYIKKKVEELQRQT